MTTWFIFCFVLSVIFIAISSRETGQLVKADFNSIFENMLSGVIAGSLLFVLYYVYIHVATK